MLKMCIFFSTKTEYGADIRHPPLRYMKLRFQLDPKSLVHFRRERELTLKQAAECLRKNDRQSSESLVNMYHRIEKSGVTSPPTAARIAEKLGATVKQLQGEGDELRRSWWVERSDSQDIGCLVGGYVGVSHLLHPILEAWQMYSAAENVTCDIDISPSHCAVSLSARPHIVKCTFRPARQTDHGLEWVELTTADQKHWRQFFLEHIRWVCDECRLNELYFPKFHELAYELVTGQSEIKSLVDAEKSEHRVYRSEEQLIRAIERLLAKSAKPSMLLFGVENTTLLLFRLNDMSCAINRVCCTDNGNDVRSAPWRMIHAVELEARLEARMREAIPYAQIQWACTDSRC